MLIGLPPYLPPPRPDKRRGCWHPGKAPRAGDRAGDWPGAKPARLGFFSCEPLCVDEDVVEGKQQSRSLPKGSLRVKGSPWEQPVPGLGQREHPMEGYVVGARKCIPRKIRSKPERGAPIFLARQKPTADTCFSRAGTGFPQISLISRG